MIDESYITSLEERIKNLIQLTKNTYERLITNTKLSPYEYKQQEDELTELIIRIMFYKKQLFRIVNSEETLEEFPTREEYAKIRHQRLLNDKAMSKNK